MLKLTLTKKTWKYIFYAVIALVLVYVVFFSSSRERFNSVNPLPSEAEMTALEATYNKARADADKNNIPYAQMRTNVLQGAPQSVKSVVKFLKANVIPLLPYSMAKEAQTPQGDITDLIIIHYLILATKPFIAPLVYAVRQQSSAPTLPEFVDMSVKILKENSRPPLPADWPAGTQEQFVIADMKKGGTTVEAPQTIPNPAYWLHKYIYGDPKVAPSGPAKPQAASKTGKASSGGAAGAAGAAGIAAGKCSPSFQQVPGGITETRCFN
jgi:hypothetical protein